VFVFITCRAQCCLCIWSRLCCVFCFVCLHHMACPVLPLYLVSSLLCLSSSYV
jgi:hypothetical protein